MNLAKETLLLFSFLIFELAVVIASPTTPTLKEHEQSDLCPTPPGASPSYPTEILVMYDGMIGTAD